MRDALGPLTDHGIRVVTTDEAITAGPDWPRPLARLASAPWLAPWDPVSAAVLADSYLLDLACARECSQADAVGYAEAGYAYVTSLDPALARREYFDLGGSDRGLRLFSLS